MLTKQPKPQKKWQLKLDLEADTFEDLQMELERLAHTLMVRDEKDFKSERTLITSDFILTVKCLDKTSDTKSPDTENHLEHRIERLEEALERTKSEISYLKKLNGIGGEEKLNKEEIINFDSINVGDTLLIPAKVIDKASYGLLYVVVDTHPSLHPMVVKIKTY